MRLNIRIILKVFLVFSTVALSIASVAAQGAKPNPKKSALMLPELSVRDVDGRLAFEGWDYGMKVTANGSLVDQRDVIGKSDGLTIAGGYKFDSGLNYYYGQHEFKNLFLVQATFARDASVKEFAKLNDQILVDSLYYYRLLPYVGPFARVGFESAMFKGFDVHSAATTYSIQRNDGAAPSTQVSKSLDLTDAFAPITLKESVGILTRPFDQPAYRLELRAGIGARETFAKGQLAIQDNSSTAAVDVVELRDVHQVGGEGYAELSGRLSNNLSYRLFGEGLMPFADNRPSTDTRGVLDVTTIEAGAGLGAKLASWATLTYDFRALKDPILFDKFQISHAVLVNFDWTIFSFKNQGEQSQTSTL